MSADIFTSLQTYSDAQLLQPLIADTNSDSTESQNGLFASMMNEYAEEVSSVTEKIPPLVDSAEQQEFVFSGNNSFVQTMVKIIDSAEENTNIFSFTEEVSPNNDVIWPEDEKPSEFLHLLAKENIPENIEKVVSSLADKVKNFVSEKLQDNNFSFSDANIEEIAEQIISGDDFAEIIASLPEEMQKEVSRVINEIASGIKQEDGTDTQPVVKLFSAISERISPSAKKSEKPYIPEDEHENQVSVSATNLAGLAVAPLNAPDVQNPEESSKLQVLDETVREKQQTPVQRQVTSVKTSQAEQSGVQAEQEAGQNFREVFVNRNAEREASGQGQPEDNNQNQNQNAGQNFTQSQDNYSGSRNSSSRSRNDSRRVDSRTQNERTESSATTRKTESRSDFSSYFEGVLTSRRSTSTSSALPLNLRETANFTQASALRDGITNVVRFIRADGVQKASIVVDPPALGRISVELTNGTSGVEASIKVASEQIRQLVQDQLSQLRMNLSQQGVQVAEFTVDVQQDNTGQHNPQQQGHNQVNFIDDTEDDETEEFRIDLEEGLLYWVA